ncbi:MAG TPA: T9SS type A sorting domain-containing protein [Fluviicola sp.]|nr:T9SS type A sorting domain-containing protein [Fluviicola sp.]
MKTQLNIMFLLLAGNCSFAQPVVTYPNGGETLIAGSTVDITWTGTALNEVVGIDYTINNWTSTVWLSTNYQNPSANGYTWTIPAVSSTQCKVGVFNTSFEGDISDNFFTITNTATISETELDQLVTVFPNPATDLIQVINTTGSPLSFQLFDQSGREAAIEIIHVDPQKSILRNTGLRSGIYTLLITDNEGISVRKKLFLNNQ